MSKTRTRKAYRFDNVRVTCIAYGHTEAEARANVHIGPSFENQQIWDDWDEDFHGDGYLLEPFAGGMREVPKGKRAPELDVVVTLDRDFYDDGRSAWLPVDDES